MRKFTILALLLTACRKETMKPEVETLLGVQVSDPHRWLEDGESPKVREWTEKQNAATQAHLDAVPGREGIYKRLEELLKIGTISGPAVAKGRYF